MNKKVLAVLSLLVVAMFLVGCGTGQAFRSKQIVKPAGDCDNLKNCGFLTKADLKLECKQFGNINPSHTECQSQGYNTCAGAALIWSVQHNGVTDLVTWPLDCDVPYDENTYKPLIKGGMGLDDSAVFIDDDALVTCCRIS